MAGLETQGGACIPRIPRPHHASPITGNYYRTVSPVPFPSPSHSNQRLTTAKPSYSFTAPIIAQCQGGHVKRPRFVCPASCPLVISGEAPGSPLPHNPATLATLLILSGRVKTYKSGALPDSWERVCLSVCWFGHLSVLCGTCHCSLLQLEWFAARALLEVTRQERFHRFG